MSPSKRAGGTMEPAIDASNESSAHGNGATSTDESADEHHADGGNGHGGRGNGASAGRARAAAPRPKRRSTPVTVPPPPERGSASHRGASSSSITRKPAPVHPPPAVGAAVTVTDPEVLAAPRAEPDTIDAVTEPVEPSAPPSAVGPAANVFDDEATSSPFGMPIVLPPAPTGDDRSNGDERPADVEALPLPVVTPLISPAGRGSQPAEIADPTWVPIAPPDVPLEPPYVTTSMTSHNVAPVPRVVGRRPRVRKVTRVVRHVDPWSVFKVALVFNLVVYGVLLTAGVLLWNVAYATGTIDNVERFFESFGWNEFEFNGGAIYHSAWIAGLFGVIGLTGTAVLGVTLFNLITDLVGGVRMTVLEEEVVERTTSPMRRFVVRRPSAVPPDPEPPSDNLPVRSESPDTPFR